MAHLAIVGSHAVNGVAELHSRLLRTRVFNDFYELWPHLFQNKTNGVSQRRWLALSNPELAALLGRAIGDRWITDLEDLRRLEAHASDAGFLDEFRRVKQQNKSKLASLVAELTNVEVDPSSLFDIQAKRIHLYKRQLLHVLHVIHEYLSIVEDGRAPGRRANPHFRGEGGAGLRGGEAGDQAHPQRRQCHQ
jgi:starch phosphorylase